MLAVSHIIPAPFAQHVVRAFLESGVDTRFFTTLTPDGRDAAAWLLRRLKLGGTRRLTGIPGTATATLPWWELLRLGIGRLGRNDILNDRVFHWGRDRFDQWVAGHMRPPYSLVYGYETGCLNTFRAARNAGLRTVYDLPSPEHDYVENLLEQENEKFPELRTPARRRFRALQAERTAWRHEEFRLADLVIANSAYTGSTWANAGLDGRKIVSVPYGAPAPDPSGVDGGSSGLGPLRLVWAGTFSVRKGAHYLLDAWRQWKPGPRAQLDVYGTVGLPASIPVRETEGIHFHGPVPHDTVLDALKSADALVFPTLCDGFGMVVNEALSRGLPVVTTGRAGAAELIRAGENGLLIEHGSAAALGEALEWCAAHRAELRAMRPAALATAAAWQWKDYRARLREVVARATACN